MENDGIRNALTLHNKDLQHVAEPQNVEGRLADAAQFKAFKTFKQFKLLKTNAFGSEIFQRPATRLDSR
jgi:hypothetical protein